MKDLGVRCSTKHGSFTIIKKENSLKPFCCVFFSYFLFFALGKKFKAISYWRLSLLLKRSVRELTAVEIRSG